MSIKAEINKKDLNQENEIKTHFIPATIDGNGPMKIEEYFNSYTTEENGVLENALRGFPLKGVEMKLPEGMTAVVLREKEHMNDEEEDRILKFSGHFDKFIYWNYDKNPSQNDAYRKMLQWNDISEALHSKVESLD